MDPGSTLNKKCLVCRKSLYELGGNKIKGLKKPAKLNCGHLICTTCLNNLKLMK